MKKAKVIKKRRNLNLSKLPFFSKEPKEHKDLTIKQLSEALPFYPTATTKKDLKD